MSCPSGWSSCWRSSPRGRSCRACFCRARAGSSAGASTAHRTAQPHARPQDSADRNDSPPGADRPARIRPQGAAGSRAHVADADGIPREVALKRVEHYAREIVPAFNAYALFPHRQQHRQGGAQHAVSGAPRARGRNGAAQAPEPGLERRIRDEPSQQHRLHPGRTPGTRARGIELCGGRVGEGVADPAAGAFTRRLFRTARIGQRSLPARARALRADRGRGRRGAGDISRRRLEPRRTAAPAEDRIARLHAARVRPARRARHRVRAGGNELRPRARRPHAVTRRRSRPGAAFRPGRAATTLAFAASQFWLRLRGTLVSLRLCLCELRLADLAAPIPHGSPLGPGNARSRSARGAGSSNWPAT